MAMLCRAIMVTAVMFCQPLFGHEPPDGERGLDLNDRIDAMEEQLARGWIADRPRHSRVIHLPTPLTRPDFNRYVQVLGIDLESHAELLLLFHDFQQELLKLQDLHLRDIWHVAGALTWRELSHADKAELTEELDRVRLGQFRRELEAAEDRLIAEMLERASDESTDAHRHWIECDRYIARYSPSRSSMPGSNVNLIAVLSELGVEYQPDDEIGAILREYVIEFGPLARRWHERRVDSAVRIARLTADSALDREGDVGPVLAHDYVEKRQRLLREPLAVERRLRDLHAGYAARLAESLEPEKGEALMWRLRYARYTHLRQAYDTHKRFQGHLTRWMEAEGWDPAELEFLTELENQYHEWFNRRIAELERRVDAWNEKWHSTFSATLEEQAEEESFRAFSSEHEAYIHELGNRANTLWASRERSASR